MHFAADAGIRGGGAASVIHPGGARAAPHATRRIPTGEAARGGGRTAAVRADRAQSAPRPRRRGAAALHRAGDGAAAAGERVTLRDARPEAWSVETGGGQHREIFRALPVVGLHARLSRSHDQVRRRQPRGDHQTVGRERDRPGDHGTAATRVGNRGRAVREASAGHHSLAHSPAGHEAPHPAQSARGGAVSHPRGRLRNTRLDGTGCLASEAFPSGSRWKSAATKPSSRR